MKMKLLCPVLVLALACTLPCAALAGKPAANDPVRKALVQAIRQHPAFATLKGWRMDIRRVWVGNEFAYVCTLARNEQGEYARIDDAMAVQQIVLRLDGEKWTPVARVEGLSESARQVQCLADERGQITEGFLQGLANNPALALTSNPTP
jgi:hypothetical protein